MFRIEIFVDDKKLAYVLLALTGHVVSLSAPQPVANAKRGPNGVQPVTRGDALELFATFAKGKKEVTPADMREFCRKHGFSANSYSNMLRRVMDAGLLKRMKKTGKAKGGAYRYQVQTS